MTLSEFFENGSIVQFSHQWEHYGEYHIIVTSFDNNTESMAGEHIIFIDVFPINDVIQGYLVDINSDLSYKSFDNTVSKKQTLVLKENDTYLIDSNGDGMWDYAFNLKSGLTTYLNYVYQKYFLIFKKSIKTPDFDVISLLVMLALDFYYSTEEEIK